jgi:hypothetical protein
VFPPVNSYNNHGQSLLCGNHGLAAKTTTYPVELVQIVGQQNHAADDSLAGRSSGLDLERAEEEVEVALKGGRVALLGEYEIGTIAIVSGRASVGQ